MAKHTVQTLLNRYLPGFQATHTLPLYQLKAVEKLQTCRTSALGGHVQVCPNGHVNGIWYNSCKHRSCPQCRGVQSERWLQRTRNALIDCPHHHIIFTQPHELNFLWAENRQVMADILFKSVQYGINTLSQDERHLGATPGYILALHTWGRNLSLHPHIHCLISHGGLTAETKAWKEPRRQSLFPAEPLRRLYRHRFILELKQRLEHGEIVLSHGQSTQQFKNLLNKLGRTTWVVHCCPRYDHGEGVSKYLARYIRGGPFNNSQILTVESGKVLFRYLDHRKQSTTRMSISIEHFLQRLLQHIPEPRKVLVRHYGLYHSALRQKLNEARQQHKQQTVDECAPINWQSYLQRLGKMPTCCECGIALLVHVDLVAESDIPEEQESVVLK